MNTQESNLDSLGCPNTNEEEDNEAPFQEESGVLFYVNRDGFPMSSKNWERMWRHVENIHPEKLKMVQRIRDNPDLEKVCRCLLAFATLLLNIDSNLCIV